MTEMSEPPVDLTDYEIAPEEQEIIDEYRRLHEQGQLDQIGDRKEE